MTKRDLILQPNYLFQHRWHALSIKHENSCCREVIHFQIDNQRVFSRLCKLSHCFGNIPSYLFLEWAKFVYWEKNTSFMKLCLLAIFRLNRTIISQCKTAIMLLSVAYVYTEGLIVHTIILWITKVSIVVGNRSNLSAF